MIHDLCTGLADQGFEFSIAVLGNGAPGYLQADAPCISLGRKDGVSLLTVLRLARLIRQGRFNILHSHGRGGAVYAALACCLAPRRWIHTVHRSDGDRISGRRWIRAHVVGRMDKVVAVSGPAGRAFEEGHDCPHGRTEVIHNGIRLARFEKNASAYNSGDVVLGSITNLSRDKDFDTLLRGFAGILRVLPNARLVIVGDGPVRGDVERLAAELGVAERVELAGYRSDVPELLTTFNVLVHSTRTEGLGLAILEAMAARVPVVASAVGGIPEIVRDGVTGMLFPAGDVEGLRDAVLAALNDPIRSAARVEAAQQDVRRRFTVERMCEEYRRLYEGLCARYSGR